MIDRFRALMPYPAVPVAHGAGPLGGLRLAVKDLFDVAGYPTGCGNPIKLVESGIKSAHAPAVARLLDAGAAFVGKAQTDELAWSLIGRNPHFGPVLNPAAPARITGGSSSGSAAAVAGDLADIALGTDTGGSVRAPASFCGIWGLRPTWGRAPLARCMPLVPSFDTCGLFARNGATLATAAGVLLEPDPVALTGGPLWARDMSALTAPDAHALLTPLAQRVTDAQIDLFAGHAQDAHDCFDIIQSREVVAVHGDWITRMQPPLGAWIADRYARARAMTAQQEDGARASRVRITRDILDRMQGRAVLAPAVHDAPIRADAGPDAQLAFAGGARKLLCLAGVAGLPQVVFPAARIDDAPLGLSLIGPPGTDLALIGLATAIARELQDERD